LLQTTLLSESLLLHHRDKLLKGEQRLVQTFNGYAFERLLLMLDGQFLGSSVHTQIRIVPYQRLLDIKCRDCCMQMQQ
jgi:hypothetical protein